MTLDRKIELDRDHRCAVTARQFVRAQLPELGCENLGERVELVASELVTNAYLHGQGKINLKLGVIDGQLVLEVVDEGRAAVKIREGSLGGGGWGLRIVDELADWGVYEGTTHVWAKFSLEDEDEDEAA